MTRIHPNILAALAIVLVVGFLFRQMMGTAAAGEAPPASGIAVVELFTSEGCSSCPPADAALADLVESAAEHHLQVYALAFHVDYWNQLGWRDRFSTAEFTDRQKGYAARLQLDSIYTPQMIVNGRMEFVGSDRAAADGAIKRALATPASGTLRATVASSENGGFAVDVKADRLDAKTTVIHVAVVERGLSSDVKRGENAGRLLKHDNVVRWFGSQSLSTDGQSVHIDIPRLADVNLSNATAIIYAQNTSDWHVLAATGAAIPRSAK